MRIVLVAALVLLMGAGGYGYFDLSRKLDATQRRLDEAEGVIASDRHTLSMVCNEYASAPKVENALNNLQGQVNGVSSEVGNLKKECASAPKVDAALNALQQQLKGQGDSLNATRNTDLAWIGNLYAQLGFDELKARQPVEAEHSLRQCLTIREATEPGSWRIFNIRSMLGESLVGQKKYAEAEPLLLAGYEGLKQREASIPQEARKERLTAAAERLVRLYDDWGKKDKADPWRDKARAGSTAGK
jgi:hypothetical protein